MPETLLKKRFRHRFFPTNFAKSLRIPFLQNVSGCCFWILILIILHIIAQHQIFKGATKYLNTLFSVVIILFKRVYAGLHFLPSLLKTSFPSFCASCVFYQTIYLKRKRHVSTEVLSFSKKYLQRKGWNNNKIHIFLKNTYYFKESNIMVVEKIFFIKNNVFQLSHGIKNIHQSKWYL